MICTVIKILYWFSVFNSYEYRFCDEALAQRTQFDWVQLRELVAIYRWNLKQKLAKNRSVMSILITWLKPRQFQWFRTRLQLNRKCIAYNYCCCSFLIVIEASQSLHYMCFQMFNIWNRLMATKKIKIKTKFHSKDPLKMMIPCHCTIIIRHLNAINLLAADVSSSCFHWIIWHVLPFGANFFPL